MLLSLKALVVASERKYVFITNSGHISSCLNILLLTPLELLSPCDHIKATKYSYKNHKCSNHFDPKKKRFFGPTNKTAASYCTTRNVPKNCSRLHFFWGWAVRTAFSTITESFSINVRLFIEFYVHQIRLTNALFERKISACVAEIAFNGNGVSEIGSEMEQVSARSSCVSILQEQRVEPD